jgi:MarR family transcriptional regulator, organic hydroperoxide resistance regulator
VNRATGRRSKDRAEVPPLGDVLEFMRMIWAIDHGLQRTSKQMAATLGITGLQHLAIRLVGRFPGISAGQLADILYIHPSTLTGVIQRLERQGLIGRRTDPRDGRRVVLGLTEKGRHLDVGARDTVESAVRDALATLPKSRVETAREVLRTLVKAL